MNTHSTRIKAIVLSIVFTMCVLVIPGISVSADSYPSSFYVNDNSFYTAAEIYVRYNSLNAEQRDIADYLLGMYNLFYLGSRGFEFKAGTYTSESSFIAKIKSLGYRLFYNASSVAWQSRMDDEFLKYSSAVLLYAQNCNLTFETWFNDLDDDFVIPVDQGILNSFTLLYNDNSDEGIASSGDMSSPWNSGNVYTFAFNGFGWNTNAYNTYSNFISSYSPIIYSDVYTYSGQQRQSVFGDFRIIPNSVFIARGDVYSNFRYGYTSGVNEYRVLTSFDTYKKLEYYISGNKIDSFSVKSESFVNSIISSNVSYSDLSDFIEYTFAYTPIDYNHNNINMGLFYPFISHVYLVDDLSNLSNLVEVFNTDSLDIVGIAGNMVVPIDNVDFKPKVLTTIDLPDNTSNPVDIRQLINDDNVVDDNGDPVDPWQINIVVQPNDTNPISIDVNLFSNGSVYLDYLWEHTKKMVLFAKDLLDCFEFDDGNGDSYGPKYAIYGVLVLGVAGGMIAKFLL